MFVRLVYGLHVLSALRCQVLLPQTLVNLLISFASALPKMDPSLLPLVRAFVQLFTLPGVSIDRGQVEPLFKLLHTEYLASQVGCFQR